MEAVFSLDTTPEYAVIGHSISECAYNDSIIPNLVNLSQSGDSYLYLYYKLRLFLDQNPSVKEVFIEFSNNQISEAMDERMWGNRYLGYKFSKYAPFMSLEDKSMIFLKNPTGFLDNSSITFKLNMDKVLHHDIDYSSGKLGGYLSLKYNKIDSLIKAGISEIDVNVKTTLSEKNLKYLTRIIQLCNDRNIKPVLVRSPLHRAHAGFEYEQLYQQVLRERFATTEYLDFACFPLNDTDFADFEHLNVRGAEKFSLYFKELLNNAWLRNEYIKTYSKDKVLRPFQIPDSSGLNKHQNP